MTDRGVIYYATGDPYVRQAEISAKSLKSHNDIDVTMYTDQSLDSPYVDNVVTITPGEYPFYDRINYFKQTPYDRTLYLDTDTYIVSKLSSVFEMLDRFEIVAAFNENRDTASEHAKFETVDIDVPASFPEYQCGAIGYRNTDTVQELFGDWQERYEPYRDKNLLDQPHFREALYNNQVSVGTLPREYNIMINFCGCLDGTARLIHYGGTNRPIFGDGIPDAETFESVAHTLNENAPHHRVFYHDITGRLRVVSRANPSFTRRVVQHTFQKGPWATFKKGMRRLLSGQRP